MSPELSSSAGCHLALQFIDTKVLKSLSRQLIAGSSLRYCRAGRSGRTERRNQHRVYSRPVENSSEWRKGLQAPPLHLHVVY